MTQEMLQQILDTIGQREGWDFSRMKTDRDPVPWDYMDVVKRYLKMEDRVLDVGTGGGEKFLQLASYFCEGVGIDIDADKIVVARSHLTEAYKDRVRFEVGDGGDLPVDNEMFDVVLNRQAGDAHQMELYAQEVVRVLRTGGVFITQEVGYRNTENLSQMFHVEPYSTVLVVPQMAKIYESLGCHVICTAEYDVRWFISDVESLIFWLGAVPGFEDVALEGHLDILNRVLNDLMTSHGIVSNEHRELLIVQKT